MELCRCTNLPFHVSPTCAAAAGARGFGLLSLEGTWGSCCSQTYHLIGPSLIITGLSRIYVGGLRFVWSGRGGGNIDTGGDWGLPH